MKPLYIWAGGKNKMIPKYQESPTIPYFDFNTYVEPFFGGGAMMVHMYLQNPKIERFILNDINSEVISLYRTIKSDVNNFILRLDALSTDYLPLSKSERKSFYYKLREEYTTDWQKWSSTEESATLYFLMKTAFNGIWQTTQKSSGRFATPSGLLNQKDSVYDKENVIEWNKFLQKVDIYCGDWKNCVQNITGKAFYFMDPPYRDSFTQYAQIFGDDQHRELIEFCNEASKNHYVLYCNRDAEDDFYDKHKGKLAINYYDVTYTAGRRSTSSEGEKEAKKAKEILLHNIPKKESHILD